jgi:hypothetical protein
MWVTAFLIHQQPASRAVEISARPLRVHEGAQVGATQEFAQPRTVSGALDLGDQAEAAPLGAVLKDVGG